MGRRRSRAPERLKSRRRRGSARGGRDLAGSRPGKHWRTDERAQEQHATAVPRPRRVMRDQPRAPARRVLEELSAICLDVVRSRAVIARHPGPEPTRVLDELIVNAPGSEKPWIAGSPLHRPRGDSESLQARQVRRIELQGTHVIGPVRIAGPSIGTATQTDVDTVSRYKLLRACPQRLLERPENRLSNTSIPARGTRLPLIFSEDGKVLLEAKVNGKGPYPFVLDTGGQAILTPATAQALGLEVRGRGISYGVGAGSTSLGYARVRSRAIRCGANRRPVRAGDAFVPRAHRPPRDSGSHLKTAAKLRIRQFLTTVHTPSRSTRLTGRSTCSHSVPSNRRGVRPPCRSALRTTCHC